MTNHRTSVYLDPHIQLLAETKYKKENFGEDFNLSSFIRRCLLAYIGAKDEGSLNSLAQEIVREFQQEQAEQQKLVRDEQEYQKKVEEHQRIRMEKIQGSMLEILSRHCMAREMFDRVDENWEISEGVRRELIEKVNDNVSREEFEAGYKAICGRLPA